jgi:hypothetical protein
MKKEFKLQKGEREVFRSYVELIRPFLKGLRSREADVFSEILYRYYKKTGVTNPRDRMALVLSSDSREEIAEQLNMNQAILRNAISALRKKSILKEGNIISDVYLLDLKDKELNLSFIFTVKE